MTAPILKFWVRIIKVLTILNLRKRSGFPLRKTNSKKPLNTHNLNLKAISVPDQFEGFLNTPDIFQDRFSCNYKTFEFPEIEITKEIIAELEELEHPRNSVLGKRMESFFEIAIRHSKRYDLTASNIQIIDRKQTLGELDFLIFDHERSKTIHVELVYKLYIYDPSFETEIKRWIGPNRRDSFYEKLEKLKTRQFPLIFKPETSEYLDDLGIEVNEIEQQLCFKAHLYLPQNSRTKNAIGVMGNYYNLTDFQNMPWKDHLFYSPKKKEWSCSPEKNQNWYSYPELMDNIQSMLADKRSPMVWMKTQTGYHRYFIVWW
ncbi:DUF1853 family protein [Christiangramia sabulilitoris]|uniref:DUF1853 family protein n=1 Tax=Christiangramia sabulilitoris TaxID=2583991 RepID=A0A550I5Y6_9FLAO|nr:DUF1853 family protein [Christiangramia sabulilitoris]TRO66389.1 DUF1853 family protein [Christiangramia sabulilitoris]